MQLFFSMGPLSCCRLSLGQLVLESHLAPGSTDVLERFFLYETRETFDALILPTTVGFQTPWGWRYDWTPKAYLKHLLRRHLEDYIWFHYHYHCLMRHNHKCFCLPHLRPRVASYPGWLERTVWHICSSRQAKTNEEKLKVEQVLY